MAIPSSVMEKIKVVTLAADVFSPGQHDIPDYIVKKNQLCYCQARASENSKKFR